MDENSFPHAQIQKTFPKGWGGGGLHGYYTPANEV